MERTTPSKQQLHQIVEQLSDAHVEAVLAFAQVLSMDPVSRALLFAPYDDEPVSDQENAEVERALQEPRVCVSLDELLAL